MKSIIKCDICGNTSESSETFLYFSLSIPKEYHYIRIIYYETNIIPPTFFILKTLSNNIDSIINEFCNEYNIDKCKLIYPFVVDKYIYDSRNIDSLPQDLNNFELYLFNRIDNNNYNDLDNLVLDNINVDNNNDDNYSPNVLFPLESNENSCFQPLLNTINYYNFTFLNFFSLVDDKCIYLYPSYVEFSSYEVFINIIYKYNIES